MQAIEHVYQELVSAGTYLNEASKKAGDDAHRRGITALQQKVSGIAARTNQFRDRKIAAGSGLSGSKPGCLQAITQFHSDLLEVARQTNDLGASKNDRDLHNAHEKIMSAVSEVSKMEGMRRSGI